MSYAVLESSTSKELEIPGTILLFGQKLPTFVSVNVTMPRPLSFFIRTRLLPSH